MGGRVGRQGFLGVVLLASNCSNCLCTDCTRSHLHELTMIILLVHVSLYRLLYPFA